MGKPCFFAAAKNTVSHRLGSLGRDDGELAGQAEELWRAMLFLSPISFEQAKEIGNQSNANLIKKKQP